MKLLRNRLQKLESGGEGAVKGSQIVIVYTWTGPDEICAATITGGPALPRSKDEAELGFIARAFQAQCAVEIDGHKEPYVMWLLSAGEGSLAGDEIEQHLKDRRIHKDVWVFGGVET